jgi:hypothetical protein
MTIWKTKDEGRSGRATPTLTRRRGGTGATLTAREGDSQSPLSRCPTWYIDFTAQLLQENAPQDPKLRKSEGRRLNPMGLQYSQRPHKPANKCVSGSWDCAFAAGNRAAGRCTALPAGRRRPSPSERGGAGNLGSQVGAGVDRWTNPRN